jgi:hypothetical protein
VGGRNGRESTKGIILSKVIFFHVAVFGEETLGGKFTLRFFLLVFCFFLSFGSALCFSLDFLHFAGNDDRVAFPDFLSTKLLVIECTFVLITVSMY